MRSEGHSVARSHEVGDLRSARRSAAQTFAGDVDEEGLLSGWMGNALVCATLPPVLAALSSVDGKANPHARQLIIIWTTLAVALQLLAMIRFFGRKGQGMWPLRRTALLLVLLLAIAAYVFLAIAPFV